MAKWQGRLQRNQIIRGAAELLALDRELRACQPHEWRLHTLTRRMLTAVARYAPRQRPQRKVNLVLKVTPFQHVDINTGHAEQRLGYTLAEIQIGTDEDPLAVAVRAVTDENEPPAKDAPDLLNEPRAWIDPAIHAAMVDFLRLDGMACWPALEGPWQIHDPVEHVVHRAARAALACERAHQDILFWNPPFVSPDRPSVWGRTVEEVYVQPWQARYQELLLETQTLETQSLTPEAPPVKVTRRFLTELEDHWTLELAWRIVKDSRKLRLDCPPEVMPLSLFPRRGQLSIEQSILQFLVDHPEGPRIRAVRAAELLGKPEGAVNDMLSELRKKHDVRQPTDEEPEWEDWLAHRDGILLPTAMRTRTARSHSHPAEATEQNRRDDA